MSFQESTGLSERQKNAAQARQALLQKFRAAAQDKDKIEKLAADRAKIAEARQQREAEKAEQRRIREAELAAERARKAELEAQRNREEEEEAARKAKEEADIMVALLAEQKAARDERYAKRKAAQKKK
jgi:hypothetical protein